MIEVLSCISMLQVVFCGYSASGWSHCCHFNGSLSFTAIRRHGKAEFLDCCNGCWFPTACKWREKGHGLAGGSDGGPFGLLTASQGPGRCHWAPAALDPMVLHVLLFSYWSRCQFGVCLCCQVLAQPSTAAHSFASTVIQTGWKHLIPCSSCLKVRQACVL